MGVKNFQVSVLLILLFHPLNKWIGEKGYSHVTEELLFSEHPPASRPLNLFLRSGKMTLGLMIGQLLKIDPVID